MYTLDHDLNSIFTRFDKKKDGLITFQDFAGEILPLEICD